MNISTACERLTISFIAFSVLVLPLFFGGVHAPVYLAVYTMCGALAFGMNPYRAMPLGRAELLLWLLVLYVIVSVGVTLPLPVAHPVLGSVSAIVNPSGAIINTLSFLSFMGMFTLVIVSLSREWITVRGILRLFTASGVVVSLIALSHWFYDSGKLFGVFSPDAVFSSTRARWPFVSSNSLGQYLLLCIFPSIHLLTSDFRSLFMTHASLVSRRPVSALDMFNTPGVQRLLTRILVHSVSLSAMMLALLGCQSRNAWISFAITLGVYLVFFRSLHQAAPPEVQKLQRERRRMRPLEDVTLFDSLFFLTRRFALPVASVVAALFILMFLRGKGLELVSDRAYYGLLSAKDDIRWQMYSDSLPLLGESPIFGVGVAAWSTAFERVADPLLAQLNPVYLHSDALQHVIETGALGTLPLILFGVILVRGILGTTRSFSPQDKEELLVIFLPLFSVFWTAFTDFPFRIPAISMGYAIFLAVICYKIQLGDTEPLRKSFSSNTVST